MSFWAEWLWSNFIYLWCHKAAYPASGDVNHQLLVKYQGGIKLDYGYSVQKLITASWESTVFPGPHMEQYCLSSALGPLLRRAFCLCDCFSCREILQLLTGVIMRSNYHCQFFHMLPYFLGCSGDWTWRWRDLGTIGEMKRDHLTYLRQ